MKLSFAVTLSLLWLEQAFAFAPYAPLVQKQRQGSNKRFMAMNVDLPPTTPAVTQSADIPVIAKSSYGPSDVRYSDFLKLVEADKIEKVTFSADGSQLLGVDVDGTRVKIEALPNDPSLLSELTDHKVRKTFVCVFQDHKKKLTLLAFLSLAILHSFRWM